MNKMKVQKHISTKFNWIEKKNQTLLKRNDALVFFLKLNYFSFIDSIYHFSLAEDKKPEEEKKETKATQVKDTK